MKGERFGVCVAEAEKKRMENVADLFLDSNN